MSRLQSTFGWQPSTRRRNRGGSAPLSQSELDGFDGVAPAPPQPKSYVPAFPVEPVTRPYAPAPSQAQRAEAVRQRSRESHERVMAGAYAQNAMKPGTPAYAQTQLAGAMGAPMPQEQLAAPPASASVTSPRAAKPATAAPAVAPASDPRATLQSSLYEKMAENGTLMPDQVPDAVKGVYPQDAAPVAATQPAVPPQQAGAGNPAVGTPESMAKIGLSEQQAREMWRVIRSQNAQTPIGQLGGIFEEKMKEYGIENGAALLNKWDGDGTIATNDFMQNDAQPTVTPAGPRIDVPAEGGAGGLVTRPNGEQAVTAPGGRQVGKPIARGAPLPATTTAPLPNGPQQGYAKLNRSMPAPLAAEGARSPDPVSGVDRTAGRTAPAVSTPPAPRANEAAALSSYAGGQAKAPSQAVGTIAVNKQTGARMRWNGRTWESI